MTEVSGERAHFDFHITAVVADENFAGTSRGTAGLRFSLRISLPACPEFISVVQVTSNITRANANRMLLVRIARRNMTDEDFLLRRAGAVA